MNSSLSLYSSASSKEVHLRRSNSYIPKARMRALKMSVVIVSSFIVCWTPYYLLGLWYWFFPDGMGATVSHSLTHMLFIFGLVNACLDPITYGLFTIHFRKGLKRYCQGAMVLAESENNSTATASLKCSPSPFRMKRLSRGCSPTGGNSPTPAPLPPPPQNNVMEQGQEEGQGPGQRAVDGQQSVEQGQRNTEQEEPRFQDHLAVYVNRATR